MSIGKLDHVFTLGDVLENFIGGPAIASVFVSDGFERRAFFLLGYTVASQTLVFSRELFGRLRIHLHRYRSFSNCLSRKRKNDGAGNNASQYIGACLMVQLHLPDSVN